MNPSFVEFLLKLKIKLYGIRQNDFVGYYVHRLENPEDKPHIKAFLDNSHYIEYNDIFFFKKSAEKAAKQKTLLTFEQEYQGSREENIILAEKLTKNGLITGYNEFNDVVKSGKQSKYYKNLYDEE